MYLYKDLYPTESEWKKINSTYEITDPSLEEETKPLFKNLYASLLKEQNNKHLNSTAKYHERLDDITLELKINDKWSTVKDSYYPQVRE